MNNTAREVTDKFLSDRQLFMSDVCTWWNETGYFEFNYCRYRWASSDFLESGHQREADALNMMDLNQLSDNGCICWKPALEVQMDKMSGRAPFSDYIDGYFLNRGNDSWFY